MTHNLFWWSLEWPETMTAQFNVSRTEPSSPGCRRPPLSSRCHGNGTWKGGACVLWRTAGHGPSGCCCQAARSLEWPRSGLKHQHRPQQVNSMKVTEPIDRCDHRLDAGFKGFSQLDSFCRAQRVTQPTTGKCILQTLPVFVVTCADISLWKHNLGSWWWFVALFCDIYEPANSFIVHASELNLNKC